MTMAEAAPAWNLTEGERASLAAAIDALLPPNGSFPAPSTTGLIDDFILRRVPATTASAGSLPYPRVDSAGLRAILATLAAQPGEMTAALTALERQQPNNFTALWRLAVFGYYSRPETIAAIQRDLAPAYHGAPLPLGYAHAIAAWDASDPLQLPTTPRGHYTRTADIRRVDLTGIVSQHTLKNQET
jgi:hypothetical protein